jgi:hypothetical protein
MIKPIQIICVLAIVALWACEKDDSELINSNNALLLYQIKYGSELYYEYTYNNSNQIVEEKSKMYYTKHNYQDSKLISSEYYLDSRMFSSSSLLVDSAMDRKEWVNPTNTEINSTKTYRYDQTDRIFRSENQQGIAEYSYNDKNLIDRQTFYHDNEPTGYIDYRYDDRGNVKKELHYWILESGVEELQTTTDYEYDNKHNPYKALSSLMMPGQYTNANNITKETYTLHFKVDPSIDQIQITENSYRYNSKGYPISKNGSETYVYY